MENALALVPGNPQLPDVGGGVLRAARGALSPVAEAVGLPGAKGDKNPTQYDPITRRYAELVLDQTGKRLDDPANRPYLIGMVDGRNELLVQARREVLLGGAVRNASSLTNPLGTVTQGEDARANKAAKDATPYGAAQIGGSSTAVAAVMKSQNDRYVAAAPQAAPYKVGNTSQAEALLMADYDRRTAMQQRVNPALWRKGRDEYLASIRRGK